jgi:Glycosyl transferase family 2
MLNPIQAGGARPRLSDDDSDAAGRLWAHASGWELRTGRLRRVSCVVLASNQAHALGQMLPRLSDMLTEFGYPWEIIVVDVESLDDAARSLTTWLQVPGIRLIHIPRAFNRLHGLAQGLAEARGDAVVTCTPGDSRWETGIPQLLLQWESGSKLICPATPRGTAERPEPQGDSGSLPAALSRLALLDRQVIERLRISA